MKTKTCTYCKVSKPISGFAKKRDGLQSRCRPCHNLYTQDHYQKNKQYYGDKARLRDGEVAAKNRPLLIKYLRDHPCVDCGNPDIRVLEFDHVIGRKSFAISEGVDQRTWESVLKEIAKCVVRCANCHRIKTQESLGHWRSKIMRD